MISSTECHDELSGVLYDLAHLNVWTLRLQNVRINDTCFVAKIIWAAFKVLVEERLGFRFEDVTVIRSNPIPILWFPDMQIIDSR